MKYLRMARKFAFEDGHLPLLFLLVFFWSMFDSILTYVTPLVMASHGFSNTMIGLLIGSSSVAGAIFDLCLCTFFKKSSFKRFFLLMLLFSLAYPVVLGNATEVVGFLLAMAVWAFYFDMYGFGVFNFVAQYVKKDEHSGAFGLIYSSRLLGMILSLLVAGILLTGPFLNVYLFAESMIVLAFACFLLLYLKARKSHPHFSPHDHRVRGFLFEMALWKKLCGGLWPQLMVTLYYFVLESFFWTLTPLYGNSVGTKGLGSTLLVAFTFPMFVAGVLVFRQKKNAFKFKNPFPFMMAGSAFLSAFVFFSSDFTILLFIAALASFFFGLALYAVNGTYTGQIADHPDYEMEIESMEDFSFNLAYVVGPMSAGILSDVLGIPAAFTALGAIGLCLGTVLLVFAPKNALMNAQKS